MRPPARGERSRSSFDGTHCTPEIKIPIPAKTTADKAYRLLQPRVPPDIRYDLHVALITHGRTVCRAQRPRCDACVLRDLCPYPSAAGGRPSPTPTTVRYAPSRPEAARQG